MNRCVTDELCYRGSGSPNHIHSSEEQKKGRSRWQRRQQPCLYTRLLPVRCLVAVFSQVQASRAFWPSSPPSSSSSSSSFAITLENRCSHAFPTIHETVEEPGDPTWSSDLRVWQGNVSLQEFLRPTQLQRVALYTHVFLCITWSKFWTFVQNFKCVKIAKLHSFSEILRVLKFDLCYDKIRKFKMPCISLYLLTIFEVYFLLFFFLRVFLRSDMSFFCFKFLAPIKCVCSQRLNIKISWR